MSKPAARLSDPTSCPVPGDAINPITTGSPNVLFDGRPAAREGDASACGSVLTSGLVSSVLINGMPAAILGSVGTHGNVVIAGSSTVFIGSEHIPAPFIPPIPLKFQRRFGQSFLITDCETGLPLAGREFVAYVDGNEVSGVTGPNGIAVIETSAADSKISLHVLFKSPARLLSEFKGDV